MAVGSHYITPINPQGYYRNSLFGKFLPRHSQRSTEYHRKTLTVEPAQTSSTIEYSTQKRKLSKSLPSLHITNLPQHIKKPAAPARKLHKARDRDKNCDHWWELPRKEYKMRSTNFDNKMSNLQNHFNTENSRKIAGYHKQETHDIYSTIDLQLDHQGISVPPNTSSKVKNYSIVDPVSSGSIQPSLTKSDPHCSWIYSRSKSGLQRTCSKTPPLQQIFTYDFNLGSNLSQSSKLPNELVSSQRTNQTFSKLRAKSLYRSKEKKPSETKSDIQTKNSHIIKLPKITIQLDRKVMKIPPTKRNKQYESEFSRHLRLLKLTYEWIKIMQASLSCSNSTAPPIPPPIPKLAVINLNTAASLHESINAEKNYTPFLNIKNAKKLQPQDKNTKLSTYSWSTDDPFSETPGVEENAPSWRPSFWYNFSLPSIAKETDMCYTKSISSNELHDIVPKNYDFNYFLTHPEKARLLCAVASEVTESMQVTEEATESNQPTEKATESKQPTEEGTESKQPIEEATESNQPTEKAIQRKQSIEEATESKQPTEEATESKQPTEEGTESKQPIEEGTESKQPTQSKKSEHANKATMISTLTYDWPDNSTHLAQSVHDYFPSRQSNLHEKPVNRFDCYYPTTQSNISKFLPLTKSICSYPDNKFDVPSSRLVKVNRKHRRRPIQEKSYMIHERTKPLLRYCYPDLAIFGHQIHHLFNMDLSFSEKHRKQLLAAAKSGECLEFKYVHL